MDKTKDSQEGFEKMRGNMKQAIRIKRLKEGK
jgi:hypothetical protein